MRAAGDGNLHPSLVTDMKNKEHFAKAQEAMEMIIKSAAELGGVVSGEHGIGLEKRKFFMETVPPAAVEIMKGIKKIVDPNNILNPGKIWEDAEA